MLLLMLAASSIARADDTEVETTQSVGVISPYSVRVEISPSSQSGPAGENRNFNVTIFNQGDNIDNYDLTIGDTMGWEISLSDNLLESVGGGENQTVTLTVTLGASGIDTITVTATSQGDNTISDSASCTASVLAPPTVITPDGGGGTLALAMGLVGGLIGGIAGGALIVKKRRREEG